MTDVPVRPPDQDAAEAARRGLLFGVYIKASVGGPWTRVDAGDQPLTAAFATAGEVEGAEVGVFVETESGGFVYWTSNSPGVFNASVLHIAGLRDADPGRAGTGRWIHDAGAKDHEGMMRQRDQRPYPSELGGRRLDLVEVGDEFRWRWAGEDLSAHEFLEIRPWTPCVVGGRLCFVARDGTDWSVSWGRDLLVVADDAYDVSEWEGAPVFIARYGSVWQVRAHSRVLAEAEGAITYHVTDGTLEVFRYPRTRGDVPIARFASAAAP